MGGVCIIPCYGEKGDEANYIDLISPEFMQKLAYIQKEANRLELGIDMTMGSGWPFGGPWVSDEYASKYLDKNLKRTKIEQYRRTKDNNWVKVVEINNFNKSTLWIAQNVIKGWIFVTYEKL